MPSRIRLATPPASPLKPSMMLKALIRPATSTTENTTATAGTAKAASTSGTSMRTTHVFSRNPARAAETKAAARRIDGRTFWVKSSTTPATNTGMAASSSSRPAPATSTLSDNLSTRLSSSPAATPSPPARPHPFKLAARVQAVSLAPSGAALPARASASVRRTMYKVTRKAATSAARMNVIYHPAPGRHAPDMKGGS